MKTRLKIIALITTPASLVCSASSAVEYHHSDEAVKKNLGEKQFSPYVGRNYLTRVLWGDQHLHTEISVDAGKKQDFGSVVYPEIAFSESWVFEVETL